MDQEKRIVTAKSWQMLVPYQSDEQAEDFFKNSWVFCKFADDETSLRNVTSGEVIGEVVKELARYVNEQDGFSTWYVVKEIDNDKHWLVCEDNVTVTNERKA
jgi:hypothetical protein